MELLTEECGFEGTHLGGSRKPDGICYTIGLENNYGIIVDTKAYSSGYSLPISQADEMERYVRENQTRDKHVNPNLWWNNYPDNVRVFYYLFISGHFVGRYQEQIARITMNTGVSGAAINVSELLLLVNSFKAGLETHDTIVSHI